MDTKKMGEKLRKLRGSKARQEVADAVGISKSALAMYEAGERIPRDGVKIRLATYYRQPVDQLFYDDPRITKQGGTHMEDKMQIFNSPEFGEVRVIEESGRVLFCGADVAKSLGYAVPRKALFDHCRDVLKRNTPTTSGVQEMSFIPESDLYRLVFRSKLPSAERFTDWVTEEVLPAIRKTGGYIHGQEELSPEDLMAKALLVAQRTIEQREARIHELTEDTQRMKPKEIFADAVSASSTTILIGDLAKILKQNGYTTGQKRLFEQLRSEGYLIKNGSNRNLPTQKAMELELFEIKETAITNSDGSVRVTRTTKVTGKGQQYFINRYLSKKG